MIGVILKSHFASAGGGPGVLVTSEVTRHMNDDSFQEPFGLSSLDSRPHWVVVLTG